MRIPDWIVTQFGFNVQNADINSQLPDELIGMCGSQSSITIQAQKTCVTVQCKY